MSWPDTYFHTQVLDATKTDSTTFHFSGSALTATVASLATADFDALRDIIFIIMSHAKHRFACVLARSEGNEKTNEEIDYLLKRDIATMRTVLRLSDRQYSSQLNRLVQKVSQLLRSEANFAKKLPSRKHARSVAKRSKLHEATPERKKLGVFPWLAGLSYEESKSLHADIVKSDPSLKFYAMVPISSEIGNLVDGHRSVNDIVKAISFEYQARLREKHVLRFLKSIERLGYISIRKRKGHSH